MTGVGAPFENETALDGLDFFALAGQDAAVVGPLVVGPGDPAHNIMRRAFFRHDRFLVTSAEGP